MRYLLLLAGCTPQDPLPERLEPDSPPATGPEEMPWVEITTHPCARREDGGVECWNSETWPSSLSEQLGNQNTSMYVRSPARKFTRIWAPGSQLAWGMDELGTPRIWKCGLPDPQGGCADGPPEQLFDPVVLGRECSLQSDGRIRCPDGRGQELYENHGPAALAHLDLNLALVTQAGRLVVRTGVGETLDIDIGDPSRVDRVVPLGNGACVLIEQQVHCFGDIAPWSTPPATDALFDNPPYQDLQAGLEVVCATTWDWQIECNNGETYSFGPYRHLAVDSSRMPHPDNPPRWETPSLCAITTDNSIRCIGERYDGYPDLLAELPVGNTP